MTKLRNNQAGFTLIEVLTAAFVLSVAVVALFWVSTRSLMLNSQAAKLHGATLLSEDVFAAVQRTVYDNALDEDPVFGSPLAVCQGGATCQMDIDATLATPFTVCTPGECDPVVQNTEGLMVQNAADSTENNLTGYEREIKMELLSDEEMLVTVLIRWEDRGRAYERTYTRTFLDWYSMEAYYEYGRVIASVVECVDESHLPNWGTQSAGPGQFDKDTAADYVANNSPECWLAPDWLFQWGYWDWDSATYNVGPNGVRSLSRDFIGEADGSEGYGTYTYDPDSGIDPLVTEWHTFGQTDEDGRTAIIIPDPLAVSSVIALRLVLKPGYLPFSYYWQYDDQDAWVDADDQDAYSAELYCHDDILNYDNLDFLQIVSGGNVYYCVAFVVQEEPIEGDQCVLPTDANTTLIDFNFERLRASGQGPNQTDTKSVSLPAGNYRIKLQAYDGYENRESVYQEHEYFFVEFLDDSGVVAASDSTLDLADNVFSTYWLGTVNQTLAVPAGVTGVRAVHGNYPAFSSDSLHAVCATFEALD